MASVSAALALLLNALTWGVSWWPFRQMQSQGLHPLWSTALIYLIAMGIMLAYQPRAWRFFKNTPLLWCLVIAAGLTNVGFNWAVTVGDVVRVILLFYLMPAWVVVLAWLILDEKPTRASLSRLALALAGVLVVLKKPDSAWPLPVSLADWLALMGGFCFGLTNILLHKLKAIPRASSMLAMFTGGAFMAIVVALYGTQYGVVTPVDLNSFAWLPWVLVMSIAFLLGNWGLQYGASRLSASATSIIMLSEVVFASCSSVLLGASSMSPQIWLGGSMILLAALLAAIQPSAKT
jgi:drug/metabolite transporter (DMT)-like permease